jgi:predicted metal-binding membrane protein
MLLLFYGGVMDFRWIIGLALYVAAEKLVPMRFQMHKFAAAALVVWGVAVLARSWTP